MEVPTRMTKAELARAMEAMPLEMVVAGFIVDQLLRIRGNSYAYGPGRNQQERRRRVIDLVEREMGL